MKVKLQYTVDIDDVPNEVDRLLKNAVTEIQNSLKAIDSTSASSPIEFHDNVSTARELMMSADLILGDCVAIVTSYNVAKANELVNNIVDQEENQEEELYEHGKEEG